MSLETYFYQVFINKKHHTSSQTKNEKYRILIPKGLNCRLRYPVNYDYAKGMLIMHKPWSIRNPLVNLLNDKNSTNNTFLRMIDNNEMPYYVMSEFYRAVKYSQQWQYECVAKQGVVNDDINLNDLDNK